MTDMQPDWGSASTVVQGMSYELALTTDRSHLRETFDSLYTVVSGTNRDLPNEFLCAVNTSNEVLDAANYNFSSAPNPQLKSENKNAPTTVQGTKQKPGNNPTGPGF